MTGFKINFSDQEASSEARDFSPLPTGKYWAKITDVTLEEVSQGDNQGKNYYRFEFTVQDGEHDGRKVWTNAMLWAGAAYTIVQIMKATGFEKNVKTGDIPDAEAFISKDVIINVRKERNRYIEERDGLDEPVFKNEVKGIFKYEGASPTPAAGATKAPSAAGSLLP